MRTVELVRLLNFIQNRSVFGNKGKMNPAHALKAQRGVELWPYMLITSALNTDEWLVPWTGHFTLYKNLQYPFNRRLCGSPSCSGHSGEEKSLLLLPGIKPKFLGNAAHSLIIPIFCLEILVTCSGFKISHVSNLRDGICNGWCTSCSLVWIS